MLLELMAAHGVAKTVLVQVIYYCWDNSYVAHALRLYPGSFMGVCRVNPNDPAAPDHLSHWTMEHGFHGVRLSPATDASGDWFAGPFMPPLFRRAEELGVPMLILTGPSRLADLARLLERYPDLDVVVDHMADCALDRPDDVQRLLDLAHYPRAYVKISHTWSISRQDYPWRDTYDLVKRVYQSFGGQRIMWATDWPVCLGRARYGQTLSVVRDEMPFISLEDREWVLSKTALKLWPFSV
jgi:predicted TIM-barrel fold metal-dependent hydrolase